jgi:hypothetical protein
VDTGVAAADSSQPRYLLAGVLALAGAAGLGCMTVAAASQRRRQRS